MESASAKSLSFASNNLLRSHRRWGVALMRPADSDGTMKIHGLSPIKGIRQSNWFHLSIVIIFINFTIWWELPDPRCIHQRGPVLIISYNIRSFYNPLTPS